MPYTGPLPSTCEVAPKVHFYERYQVLNRSLNKYQRFHCSPTALLYLCAINEDDAVGVEGHTREELEELLERVSVGLGEE